MSIWREWSLIVECGGNNSSWLAPPAGRFPLFLSPAHWIMLRCNADQLFFQLGGLMPDGIPALDAGSIPAGSTKSPLRRLPPASLAGDGTLR